MPLTFQNTTTAPQKIELHKKSNYQVNEEKPVEG